MYEDIIYQKKDGIAEIILNRPKKLNALRNKTKEELLDVLLKVEKDRDIRVVILSGAGGNFSAGQDLSEAKEILNEVEARQWIHLFMDVYDAFKALTKPTIASVNGYAVGGACQFTLLTDITIGTESSKYGLVEIDAGLACITGSYLFWGVMGYKKAKELTLTGEIFDAKEAYRLGLINKVVPDNALETETYKMAKMLSEKAPTAIRSDKIWWKELASSDYLKAKQFAADLHALGYESGEPKEAMEKFVKKER